MLIARDETEIMILKFTKNGHVVSKQQENREVGFRHYMHEHFPSVTIHDLELPIDQPRQFYDNMLEKFFTNYPNVHQCITMAVSYTHLDVYKRQSLRCERWVDAATSEIGLLTHLAYNLLANQKFQVYGIGREQPMALVRVQSQKDVYKRQT